MNISSRDKKELLPISIRIIIFFKLFFDVASEIGHFSTFWIISLEKKPIGSP